MSFECWEIQILEENVGSMHRKDLWVEEELISFIEPFALNNIRLEIRIMEATAAFWAFRFAITIPVLATDALRLASLVVRTEIFVLLDFCYFDKLVGHLISAPGSLRIKKLNRGFCA